MVSVVVLPINHAASIFDQNSQNIAWLGIDGDWSYVTIAKDSTILVLNLFGVQGFGVTHLKKDFSIFFKDFLQVLLKERDPK
jgi:hypothetical protein